MYGGIVAGDTDLVTCVCYTIGCSLCPSGTASSYGTMIVPVLPASASTALSRELIIARDPPSSTNLMAEATFGTDAAGQEMALGSQLVRLRCGHLAERAGIRLAEVQQGVFDVGEHHEGVRTDRLRHDLAGAVLVDDRLKALIVTRAVLHDGDPAAAEAITMMPAFRI